MIWLIGNKGMLGNTVSTLLKETDISYIETDKEVDITNINTLEQFIKTLATPISHIINCAAYTDVDNAELNSDMAEKINTIGIQNIAIISKKLNATVIHISTDYVFNGKNNTPYTEDCLTSPINLYGKTKANGELILKKTINNYYLLRTAWMYGKNGKNFVSTIINLLETRDNIKVVNDQIGCPTYTKTVAQVIIKIITYELHNQKIPYGTYNITDKGECTWYDFATEIQNQASTFGIITNTNCIIYPCTSDEFKSIAKRPKYSVLDNNKISKFLNYENISWKENLVAFLNQDFSK